MNGPRGGELFAGSDLLANERNQIKTRDRLRDLAEVRRKLRTITAKRYGRGERYEHRVRRCLASIYGIDIDHNNVTETRDRPRSVIGSRLATTGTSSRRQTLSPRRWTCSLARTSSAPTPLNHGNEIEVVDYQPGAGATFVRESPRPLDARSQVGEETDRAAEVG